jgi:hypothetical protein
MDEVMANTKGSVTVAEEAPKLWWNSFR